MANAAIENIDPSKLSAEENSAFAILKHLSVDQVNQLKQLMKLGKPGVIGPATVTMLVQLCQQRGIDLSKTGVNAFKDKHRLNNMGPNRGVIGPQTAKAFFDEILSRNDSGNHPPLKGALNLKILSAAQSLRGMCTTDGPDGGNNACAWSINQVLAKARIAPLGDNPNYVPSLVAALQGDRGQQVSRSAAKAGDLVVANESAHIGIGMDDGCHTVLSNSSSRGAFQWESNTDFDGYYGGPSTIYRLIK